MSESKKVSIKTGCIVKLIAGRGKGSVGMVDKVFFLRGRKQVVVKGANISQRVSKKDSSGAGRCFSYSERGLDVSNVVMYCS